MINLNDISDKAKLEASLKLAIVIAEELEDLGQKLEKIKEDEDLGEDEDLDVRAMTKDEIIAEDIDLLEAMVIQLNVVITMGVQINLDY